MIWIVPRTNQLLLELLMKYGEISLISPDNVGDIQDSEMNLRKAKSSDYIYASSSGDHWWTGPHFLCKERYSSMGRKSSAKKRKTTSDTSAFANHLGPHSSHLVPIPVPPMPVSGGLLTPLPLNDLLVPHSVQNVQSRYYLRRTDSTDSTLEQNLEEMAKILKVTSTRHWQQHRAPKKSSKRFEFTLMCYNVLAQNLLDEHPYLYRQHNQNALKWDTRWKNLFNEIKTMRPDILCLQEVQQSHLAVYYSQLETLGYQGLYKKRTGIRCDGCALYYKPDRLNLVEYETVEFYQPHVPVLNRDNVAIVAKLCPRHSPSRHFVVATTHLLYNPRRQDVRLAQTQLLLTEVERLSFHWNSKGNGKYWPIIITGDFNSTPDSAVYELITKGILKYDHLAATRLNRPDSPRHGNVLVPSALQITDKCQHASLAQKRRKTEEMTRTEEAALIKLHNSDKSLTKISSDIVKNPEFFSSGTLRHLFQLKSVYQHGEPDDPEGTTYQNQWLTVDYIFYSCKKRGEQIEDHKLKLLSSYRLPLKSELGTMKIPNSLMGSDHLSLVAKFKMRV